MKIKRIYVCDIDGKEFSNREDCLLHENYLKFKADNQFKKIDSYNPLLLGALDVDVINSTINCYTFVTQEGISAENLFKSLLLETPKLINVHLFYDTEMYYTDVLYFKANTKYIFVEIIDNETCATTYRVMGVNQFESCVQNYLGLIKE